MKMNIFFKSLMVIIFFLIYGCSTTPSHLAQRVKIADQYMVRDCLLLGEVTGSSSHAGVARSFGIPRAKNEARERAAKMGATHIVWKHIESSGWVNVTGNAYQCKN